MKPSGCYPIKITQHASNIDAKDAEISAGCWLSSNSVDSLHVSSAAIVPQTAQCSGWHEEIPSSPQTQSLHKTGKTSQSQSTNHVLAAEICHSAR